MNAAVDAVRLPVAHQQHNLPRRLGGIQLGSQHGDNVGVRGPGFLCPNGAGGQLGDCTEVGAGDGIRLLLHLDRTAAGLLRLGDQTGQPGLGDDANHAATAEPATAAALTGRRRRGRRPFACAFSGSVRSRDAA